MKKIFVIAAAACTVLASCQKEASVASVQNDGQQEITFSALSKAMTKGVLGSGDSFDAGLGTTPTHRIITVAGTMVKDGGIVDFLPPTDFAQLETSGTWEAAVWNSTTPGYEKRAVYYPIGGQDSDFHFLAYSEVQDVDPKDTKPSVSRWYSDSEVEIYVDDNSQYNEIVYSGFEGKKDGAAPATFSHSQALVSVTIKAKNTDIANTSIKINKIGFKDVKTSGTLLLKYDVKAPSTQSNKATAQWLFNAGCTCKFADMGAKDITVEDTKEKDFTDVTGKLGAALNTDGFTVTRLFPAQELDAKTMVVNYTLGDLTTEVELPLDGNATPAVTDHANAYTWEANKHYKYTITVNLREITIDPTTESSAWTVESTTGEYDLPTT